MITNTKENLEIRPLYDLESGTWTYLILDQKSKQSVLVDPVLER
ncbi:Zn-dependent hydrolase, partial [Leptospira meyeri]